MVVNALLVIVRPNRLVWSTIVSDEDWIQEMPPRKVRYDAMPPTPMENALTGVDPNAIKTDTANVVATSTLRMKCMLKALHKDATCFRKGNIYVAGSDVLHSESVAFIYYHVRGVSIAVPQVTYR